MQAVKLWAWPRAHHSLTAEPVRSAESLKPPPAAVLIGLRRLLERGRGLRFAVGASVAGPQAFTGAVSGS